MKTIKIFLGFIILLSLTSCTKDFKEINTNPNGITQDEASAKYFITVPQYKLYAPDRYPYWRAHLIHTDRYAGYFTFGFNGCWWSDALGYSYSTSYTDASWDWLAGYLSQLDNFLKLTATGGEFENEYMYAAGLIMKGLYYQMYTDVFGEIPYSEAADPDVTLPKFDTQKEIYQGIIADLDEAMTIIGDAETSGDGVSDLGDNDLYCAGDMQKWKKLANSLKLRVAMRANGATGDDFSASAINSVISAGLFLETEADNVLLTKDQEISQWDAAAYGDIWYRFGGFGSKWHVGEVMVNYLRDYNDPRLSLYAKPAEGGTFGFKQPELTAENPEAHNYFFERVQHIRDKIADAIGNTDFYEEFPDSAAFIIPENTYYIGQPTRLNGDTYDYARWEFFSAPADVIVNGKQDLTDNGPIFNELVFTTAEAYFLRAEAAVNGYGSENAQSMFQEGIRHAMKIWGVDDGAIETYLGTSTLADISGGTTDEKLEKISIQRWLASYTDGFEGWSIIRKSGYPSQLAAGVTNDHIYYIGGDIGAMYPQRLRYGTGAYANNGTNLETAIGRQGTDNQTTKLWFAK